MKRSIRHWIGWIIWVAAASGANPTADTTVAVLTVRGAIGPATTDYLTRGIEAAEEAGDAALVIELDTPGGLDAATRDINQAILAARVPIITFVHPEGARAASAGTYILYASHVAAMAPATNLGAATPIQLIGGAQPDAPRSKDDGDDADSPDGESDGKTESAQRPADAMSRKAVNDAAAYIRGLAEKRGRNADWAERAVREAESLTASAALDSNVIDVIAADLASLLEQVDGMTVEVRGKTMTLQTAGAEIRRVAPDLRNAILAQITNPTVAYLLFLIGLYGLLFEGYSPGALVPGIVGGICLILALYAFQVLPINYAGVLLIVLGVALLAAETFAPSFGVLGIGGIVAVTIGSLILIDTDLAELVVSRGVIATIGGASALAFLGLLIMVARARRAPQVTGVDLLVGARAPVLDDRGRVSLQGETWLTRSAEPLARGEIVEVTAVDGLTLVVRKNPQGDTP